MLNGEYASLDQSCVGKFKSVYDLLNSLSFSMYGGMRQARFCLMLLLRENDLCVLVRDLMLRSAAEDVMCVCYMFVVRS